MTKSLTPVGRLLKEIDEEKLLQFRPTSAMERAKYRFWKTIRDNSRLLTEVGDMTLSALAEHSGSPNFMTWADKCPMFLPWFCDEKFDEVTLHTLAQEAMVKVREIMHAELVPKLITAKDQLNAANMLLQLGDKYPNKRREFVYVDKELAKMTDIDVKRENDKLDRLLSGAPTETND